MARRYSAYVVVYLRYADMTGRYVCTVKTPDGVRRIYVGAPTVLSKPVDSKSAFDEAAKAAINFAVDEDERGVKAKRGGDDIFTSTHMEIDEAGELVIHVSRRDAWGGFYVTSYCNFAHELHTGKPIGHECRTIPPEALYAEMSGHTNKAMFLMQAKWAEWARPSLDEGLLYHSVQVLSDSGATIDTVRFRLWEPDGPRVVETIDRDIAVRVCGELTEKHMRAIENPKGTYGGHILGGFEVVSERRS